MCDFLKHLFRKKCQLQNPELKGYVSTFFPISEFSYFVLRFSNHIFLSLTFPISLSDFTIELLTTNLITKYKKLMTKKNLI